MSEFTIIKSTYVDTYNEWSDWRPAIDVILDTGEKNIVELGLGIGTRQSERFGGLGTTMWKKI